MDFRSFTEHMRKEAEAATGLEVRVENVIKNNGTQLTGLVFMEKDINCHSTLYLEELYKRYEYGADLSELTEELISRFRIGKMKQSFDLSHFTDYEKVHSHIVMKLVNYEKNKEQLQKMPHRRCLDLAITYYYLVIEPPFSGKAIIQINNKHMKCWGVTEEMLYAEAKKNTPELLPAKIITMLDCMLDLVRMAESKDNISTVMKLALEELLLHKDKIPMYVVKNSTGSYGAVSILYDDILKDFANSIGVDLYILPSSIHETIIVPVDDTVSADTLREMVTEINEHKVVEEERLADNVYIYKHSRDTITIA